MNVMQKLEYSLTCAKGRLQIKGILRMKANVQETCAVIYKNKSTKE